ncbi:MAG: DUF998 domain-containing protein [Ktedonobacterales bacterium]
MQQAQVPERGTSRLHLLIGTVIGGIIVTALLEVIVQLLPPHFSPISQSESDLALGPFGYLMTLNFVLRGVVMLLFIAAFMNVVPKESRSRSGLILLGVSAVGKLILAFVPTDLTSPPHTVHGAIHALVALASFFCGALGVLLMARALRHSPTVRPSQRILMGLAVVTLIWSLVVIGTVAVSSQIGVWGLFERLFDGLFYLWILIASIGLWQSPSLEATPLLTTFPYSARQNLEKEAFPA